MEELASSGFEWRVSSILFILFLSYLRGLSTPLGYLILYCDLSKEQRRSGNSCWQFNMLRPQIWYITILDTGSCLLLHCYIMEVGFIIQFFSPSSLFSFSLFKNDRSEPTFCYHDSSFQSSFAASNPSIIPKPFWYLNYNNWLQFI